MSAEQNNKYMRIALEQSKKALPDCLPNPPVGCVLVKEGKIISYGYTKAPGENHAEAEALNNYSGSLEGVSAYVTLEPCSFHGRTPSCATSFIERQISEVYIGIKDIDPRNNGKGVTRLKAAGIKVTENVLSESVIQFLNPYLNKS
ncbi:MAG: bifunctional diaminohydroxyphosphoribosylaminopyrimidine deaminase/5-amino-6-(5-phosphoribosylamino)uracil reductase RibD [Oceanicoccus sp.]